MRIHPHEYIFENKIFGELSYADILQHSNELLEFERRAALDFQPLRIETDLAIFYNAAEQSGFPKVSVSQVNNALILHCECDTPKIQLCRHQSRILHALLEREYFKIFFDAKIRDKEFREFAKDYGLENEENLDDFFEAVYENKTLLIKPKIKELIAVNAKTQQLVKEQLLPKVNSGEKPIDKDANATQLIMVFRKNKYYEQLNIELLEAKITKDGKVKNPFKVIEPLDLIQKTERLDEAKFYTGISKFQNTFSASKNESDLEWLKLIIQNPLNIPSYFHDVVISENINANSIRKVKLSNIFLDINLDVAIKSPYYEITGKLVANDKSYPLKTIQTKFIYFVLLDENYYLIGNTQLMRVIDFFKKNNEKILIHPSKFEAFKSNILEPLEDLVHIRYSYIKPATAKQIKEQAFDQSVEQLIYLSDEENYVYLTPIVKYGNIEVPVFSRKQVHDMDPNGNVFLVERDEELEAKFTAILLLQHPEFEEQLTEGRFFYLHKKKFIEEEWFLNAFETWKNHGIHILGFNELKNNKLNPHKAKITIRLNSGIDWFNTHIIVKFNEQIVKLKQLHKAVKNKSRFVQLDDGTQGILPQEWLDKFATYFQRGDVFDDFLRIPKSHFQDITDLFEEEVISKEALAEIETYRSKFSNFESIPDIVPPADLKGSLRHYQQQGLNWLNFLDDYNFGACLADDMGLGKTIQVLAFLLTQRTKHQNNCNLVIVPASLLFNWQAEVEKFAPSLKIFTHYGLNRMKQGEDFKAYEIVLTTYGMLLSDLSLLKSFVFNYIILDESQVIKNPDSQRYKAARLLQSRNKIVLTGTPIENNTFDLYGQLSFACPGLLGSKEYFRDIYSIPIDKFESSKRAKELQNKVNPFILRRTKKQVAKELPEKTEMVIYCEMGTEQRTVYDYYENELREYLEGRNEDEIKKSSMHVLTGLTKLRQICNSPALLKEQEYSGDYSAKTDALMEQLESKYQQHKILVFSQFVSMLNLIKTELDKRNIKYAYLTGQTKNREAVVNEFQNNDEVRVFLISLKAGGTGLNLTEADYVYLVDPWWNPSVENQAIDRSYRIGQQKNVIAVRLICPDTIEEKIMRLQESKNKLVNDLIKTDALMLKSLSKADLLAILK